MNRERQRYDKLQKSIINRGVLENLFLGYCNAITRANVEIRADASVKVMVIRESSKKCCNWCEKLNGIYEYGTEPNDFFKRHDNCTCIIFHETMQTSTDVWITKKFEQERAARIQRVEKFEKKNRFLMKYARKRRIAINDKKLLSIEAEQVDFEFMSKNFKPRLGVEKNIKIDFGSKIHPHSVDVIVKKVLNSECEIYAEKELTRRSKIIRLIERYTRMMSIELSASSIKIPTIVILDFEKNEINSSGIAAYHKVKEILLFNSKYDTEEKIAEFLLEISGRFASTKSLSPYRHELGHHLYQQLIKSIAKTYGLPYEPLNEMSEAKQILDTCIADYVHMRSNEGQLLGEVIGEYAEIGYRQHNYSEVVAECYASRFEKIYAEKLIESVMRYLK